MALSEIVKLISDAGVSVVLLGLAIWYIFHILNNRKKNDDHDSERLKKYDEQQNQKSQRWEEIIADLVVDKLHTDHIKEEPYNNSVNERVTDIMQVALKDAGCSRVLLFSYHNGGKDYEGRSYQRMSCINEVIQPTSYPIQSKYNNMFRTSMYALYQELNSQNYFNIPDIASIHQTDPGTYCMLKQDGIHALFGCGLHNKSGNIVGFLTFCYDEARPEYKDIISVLKRSSYQIEGVYLTAKEL